MNTLFSEQNVLLNERISSQRDVFIKIAEHCVSNNIASSSEKLLHALEEREKQSTTGFIDGFAIPHAKSSSIQIPSALIITLSEGIDWDSMDQKPVKFIISLLIPENEAATTHLTALSNISRMLIHQEIRENLLEAQNKQEVLQLIDESIVSI
ncbi:fructose PTS transporter subunit IIA [Niallia sp.]|uniref:PTS sugar transporter subunit IIA n=1 Tax=Niallia sp. TaxID=2837523 RepID=UPI00289F9237|nr:fructose PTS transporter subunit IIA [Niallia sp.]